MSHCPRLLYWNVLDVDMFDDAFFFQLPSVVCRQLVLQSAVYILRQDGVQCLSKLYFSDGEYYETIVAYEHVIIVFDVPVQNHSKSM